ncbi:MAG TPA: glycosyltransferase [Acidimicrobiales bacterium]|nr:glycosyltransferase [Acidimicrobiales bacterium]
MAPHAPVPDLSLVIPVFNEERRLADSLLRLDGLADAVGVTAEVIVADDGSSDGTVEIARQFAATPGRRYTLRVVEIVHRGKGAAVRAGLREARAPVVGYCDVDLSAGLDALAALYDEVKGGADLAMASRGLADSILETRQPWYRERAGRVFNSMLRHLVDIPFRDTQCGLKLLSRKAADEILRHQRIDGFAFDAEMVVLAHRLDLDIREVPVRWSHDAASKVSMVRDSMAMSRDVVRIVRRLRVGKLQALGVPAAAALDVMTSSEKEHWWYVAKRLLIRRYWQAEPLSGRCIDIGCGGGAVLADAAGSMPAFGVDLSPRALEHGQSVGLSMLARAEAGALPFSDDSFSIAFALDVLEHHPSPERLLAEVRRILTDQGMFVVSVPAFQWMWSYADHVLGHYRRYTKPQLVAELTRAGFTIERATYFHSWLLPLAWLFRRMRSLTGRVESADDFAVHPVLNRLLLAVCRLEQRWLTTHEVPFGLSVLAVARPARRGAPAGAA